MHRIATRQRKERREKERGGGRMHRWWMVEGVVDIDPIG